MTLQQYCSRGGSEKASIGSVEITEDDIKHLRYQTINQALKQKARLVQVKEFNFAYRIDYINDQVADNGILWTMDDHGNKKARSVFRLK